MHPFSVDLLGNQILHNFLASLYWYQLQRHTISEGKIRINKIEIVLFFQRLMIRLPVIDH